MKNRDYDRKGRIAEKIMELGNLIFLSMAVTQIFLDKPNLIIAVIGSIILVGAYFTANHIMKGGSK